METRDVVMVLSGVMTVVMYAWKGVTEFALEYRREFGPWYGSASGVREDGIWWDPEGGEKGVPPSGCDVDEGVDEE